MDALMSRAQEAQERRFHSMIAVLTQWVPLCLLQGRSCSGGLFWLLFWAVAKE